MQNVVLAELDSVTGAVMFHGNDINNANFYEVSYKIKKLVFEIYQKSFRNMKIALI